VHLIGVVRIAKLKSSQGYIAVKAIRKDYVKRHHDERHIKNEKEILIAMKSCPFTINLFGTFQDSRNVYFAMELAAGGELFRRLNKKENFSNAASKFYAIEIFIALEHMHNLGYVYRDLKPENIMLDENGHCKLVDFGFSTAPDSEGLCHTSCGTPAYLSPEQLNGKFTNGYTKTVDWWALGCFVYELCCGITPFCKNNKETPYEIYLRVLKGKIHFPRKVDQETKDLISCLCLADLGQRLKEPELIKNHAYFLGVAGKWDLVRKCKLVPPFVPRIREDGDDRHFDDYTKYFQDKIEGGQETAEVFVGF
jgi:protein kinase A